MGNVEDARKVIQDFVAPDLKALTVQVESLEAKMDLKFEAVLAKMDLDFKFLSAKIDASHATVMNALTIDKRLEALERKHRKEPSHA